MFQTTAAIFCLCALLPHVYGFRDQRQQVIEPLNNPKRVPVILGVMSQCPDAIYCESVFDKVLKEVGDIVDLQLSFVGK